MAVHHPAPHPAPQPVHLFSLGEVFRIIAVTVLAGVAIGYLLANYNDQTPEILARILGAVALTTVVYMIFEGRRRARIDRVDERLDRIERLLDDRLERQRRWVAYSDALADLGAIDGESSTDSGHLPHHP
jgi:uncharacterized membrane protein YfcA